MEIIDKKTQYAVIGLGIFGMRVALSLVEEGADVLVTDRDPAIIDKIKDRPLYAYVLDSTNEDALKEAGVDSVDCVIICIGIDMVASILTTLLMRKFKIPRIIARANTREHAQILKLIGVNEIVQPEMETAEKLARQLVGQGGYVISYDQIWKDHAIVEIKVTENIQNKSLSELDLRQRFHVNVVALKHVVERLNDDFENVADFEIDEVPDPSQALKLGDILVIIGQVNDIRRLNTEMREK